MTAITGLLERSAEERVTEGLIETLRHDSATRVLVVRGDRAPLAAKDRLELVSPSDVGVDAEWAFLGRRDGVAHLVAAVDDDAEPALRAAAGWHALRVVGGDLAAADADMFSTGLSLARWLRETRFCSACGDPLELRLGGWARSCSGCRREHFPRTDPAVIVAVTDGDRLLLGSNAMWGGDRYSCFAGFVEAGETLEAAVAREVAEEAGVRVRDVQYRGSQGWPYPRSLMLGFRAGVVAADEAEADGEEIVDVRWFSRDEIAEALAGAGAVTLPGTSSIAHRLIRDWCEEGA